MAFGGGGGGGPAGNGVSVQLEASSVLTVAESAGLSGYLLPSENGPPAAAERLAEDADFRLRELVQEAVKVMRHGRRTQLTAEDVSTAIRLLGCEPLYGYGTHGLFRQNERQRGDCTGGGPAGAGASTSIARAASRSRVAPARSNAGLRARMGVRCCCSSVRAAPLRAKQGAASQ